QARDRNLFPTGLGMIKENGMRTSMEAPMSAQGLPEAILNMTVGEMIARLLDVDHAKVTQPEGIADPDYKSPHCPEGYDTVVGYLTEHLPHVWELMDHMAEATQRDGWWLKHRCRERSIAIVRVQAS